ncbi:hypothetical protein BH18THE2_BH18THE2_25580 [soil metagenome]
MLSKHMRKKLLERTLLEIEKKESNPTQMWSRLRNTCVRAIDDLILVAKKLPEDKQKEIFTPHKIDEFVSCLLYRGDTYPYPHIFNPHKAELASRLVERGVSLNSYQFHLLNRGTPSLVEPTSNHLKQAVSICRDISYKLQLKKIEEEAVEAEIVYLFSWNEMVNKEKHRLLDFITNKTGEYQIEIIENTVKRTNNNKKLECNFGLKVGEDIGDVVYGTVSIFMDDTKKGAEVSILDNNHNIIHKEDLLVQKSEEQGNDFNLYMKKNKIKVKKKRL